MPKKFKGENSKAQEARARKSAAHEAEQEQKKKVEEDAQWADDDKHCARKMQRKEDKEKKRLEQLERKKELQQLAEEEMKSIKGPKVNPTKVTRSEIQANQEKLAAEAAAAAKKEEETPHDEKPLEENLNRLQLEGDQAKTVEEAISVLKDRDPELEKHPEKRVKAAYNKFEEENLPRVKAENSGMRLSQLKHMLKKEWMKSPDNPLNQRFLEYNQKR